MNMTTLILFGSFVLFLVLGLPVSISLGLSSLVSFFYCGIPIVTIAQRLYTGMDSFPLMAIPLFILAGNLMTAGGISRKIVDFANILTGRVRGGLAYTAILACAIFAALSGSGPATTIAIGAMIYPSMKEIKYPEAQSAGRGQPVRHGQHLRSERRRDHQRRDAVLHCQSLRRAAHYFRPRGHRVGRRLKNPCRCEAAPAS